jgi:hypothetical protein
MKNKVFVTLACMAFAVVATGAMAGERFSATPAPWANGASPKVAQASTDQCDPACVAPEICCRLSGLEAACLPEADCFRKQQKLKTK